LILHQPFVWPSVDKSALLLNFASPSIALVVCLCQAFVGATGQSQVGVGPIRSVVQQLVAMSDRKARIIVIGTCKLSPQAKIVVLQEAPAGTVVEYFMEAELLFDITEHALVPLHEILTSAEKKALLDK
jgi:DNA-directed RNA polymerase I, II, and III subunit RPABC1